MAEIVTKKEKATPGEDDLQVLHPERTAVIAGRSITMREYGFIEGLKVRALAKPLIATLHATVASGRLPEINDVQFMLAEHAENVAQLIAQAADLEPEWVLNLKDQYAGDQLLAMWWGCNGHFFIRKAIDQVRQNLLVSAMRAGLMPTPNSSPTATTQTESASTLNDK